MTRAPARCAEKAIVPFLGRSCACASDTSATSRQASTPTVAHGRRGSKGVSLRANDPYEPLACAFVAATAVRVTCLRQVGSSKLSEVARRRGNAEGSLGPLEAEVMD